MDDIQSRLTYPHWRLLWIHLSVSVALNTSIHCAHLMCAERKKVRFQNVFADASQRKNLHRNFKSEKLFLFILTKALSLFIFILSSSLFECRKPMLNTQLNSKCNNKIQYRWMYSVRILRICRRGRKKGSSTRWMNELSTTRCHDPFSQNKYQIDGKSVVADLVHNAYALSLSTSIYFYSWFLFISFVTKERKNCRVSHVEAPASHPYR